MKRLDRYVAMQVFSSIAIVLVVVLGLDFVFAYMDEVKDADEVYTSTVILQFLALKLPGSFYEFLPLSSLVGCLIGLGMLASHSELTVMRAAGISTSRIILSVIKPALILAFLSMLAGEFLVPVTEQLAQSKKAVATSGGKAVHSQSGVWHREKNTYIHINTVNPNGQLLGVTRFDFDEQGELLRSSFAKEGRYEEDHWQLNQISYTEFLGDSTQVSEKSEERWELGLSPHLLLALVVEPKDLALSRLWTFSNYLSDQSLQADSYYFAFWSKVFQPLTVVTLVLIGILFIFGPLRSVTVGQRIIAGVITGLMFKFIQDILGQMSSLAGVSPLVAVFLPIFICLVFGVILIKRSRV